MALVKREDGRQVMTPSALENLQHTYNLTPAEAEEVFVRVADGEAEDQVAQAVKDSRVIYRAHVSKGYSPESDPRLLPQRKREAEEAHRQAFANAEDLGPAENPQASGTVTRAGDLPR